VVVVVAVVVVMAEVLVAAVAVAVAALLPILKTIVIFRQVLSLLSKLAQVAQVAQELPRSTDLVQPAQMAVQQRSMMLKLLAELVAELVQLMSEVQVVPAGHHQITPPEPAEEVSMVMEAVAPLTVTTVDQPDFPQLAGHKRAFTLMTIPLRLNQVLT
jgi:hypothetical protein